MTQYHRDIVPKASVPMMPNPDPYGRAQIQLTPGDLLLSATGAFLFAMDGVTGNLTLSVWDESLQGWRQILSFGINGAKTFKMQDDGNLVAYDENSKPLWAATWYWYKDNALPPPNSYSFFRCQDDGNLVVYSGSGVALGSSRTYAGTR